MDSVENGIVEVIRQRNVKWLVMGAAADKHYSKYVLFVLFAFSFSWIWVWSLVAFDFCREKM